MCRFLNEMGEGAFGYSHIYIFVMIPAFFLILIDNFFCFYDPIAFHFPYTFKEM